MKLRFRSFLAVLLIVLLAGASNSQIAASPLSGPAIEAKAAVLLEQSSGKVLYSKLAQERMYPASLTKLLSALVLLQYGGELEETVVVGRELLLVKPNSSRAGLQVGDRISLRNLLYAMLLPSGNDAAYVAAVHAARAQANDSSLAPDRAVGLFAAMMNQMAADLGATHSHFINPDGYHDSGHYSTAIDLALIASRVMQNELLREVVGENYVTVQYVSHGRTISRSYSNTNRLLNPTDEVYYAEATGLKTGTTSQAGHCLAAAASESQLNLIAIILDSDANGRWQDARRLLEYGFAEHQLLQLCAVDEPQLTVKLASRLPGFFAEATLSSSQGAEVVIARVDAQRVVSGFIWDDSLVRVKNDQVIVRFPVAAGTVVGQQVYRLGQSTLAEVPLVVSSEVFAYRPSLSLLLMLLTLSGLAVVLLLPHFRHRH